MVEEEQRFSPQRVAWIAAVMSQLLIPCHFFVSCDRSDRLTLSVIGLVLISCQFTLADRTGKRTRLFGLAVVGMVAHTLSTH